ncbi:hypothetical protein GCM10010256_74200 [Streptomyces coeruleorubidus]|nr:hypothetical protein GCM10010256_74200 [Streptomyces coeruleorubidus]
MNSENSSRNAAQSRARARSDFRRPAGPAGSKDCAATTLTANTDPDQHLTVWTAAPGSPTHERLRSLASWATEQNLSPSSSLR